MKYCTNCGKKLEENSGFCTECGNKIVTEEMVDEPKKEVSGCSIAGFVLGICVHAYQAFFFFVVLLFVDSITFLTTLFFGRNGHISFLDKIWGVIYFLK